ncbi:MAG: nucleotidyltransferase family protein, partial [Clostridia bacterium]|nr:nucleotidyltransferase family protein [Clostridia bacterium]
ALTRTAEALSAAEIRFLPLKGAVMREYYPEPWLRTSSDIDILVEPCNLERAIAHLGEVCGYRLDRRSSHDVSLYTPEGVHVELHYDLIGEGLVAKAHEVLAEVWQDATPVEGQPYHYRSSDAFFYFYHIAHMAKHILQGGCGIRPLLDLWLLSRHCPDSAAREALLERGGLSRFAAVAHNLAEGWFSGGVLDEAAQKMQEYVLQAGVYGTKRNYIKMKQSKRGGRLGYALSKIFLPYDVIKYQYPVLQKHRWLTPFYEVHRWCRLIFCGGARRSLHELSVNAAQSREDMRETAAFIDSIGL